MRFTKAQRKELTSKMLKDIKENGPVRLSYILGFRNTSRVENWKQRRRIPIGMEPLIERALNCEIEIKEKEQ